MLRVVEEAARTDTGRQRQRQRGRLLTRARRFTPSRTAWVERRRARSRRGSRPRRSSRSLGERASAEEKLARIASEANRRIFELARADSSRSGMGTTLTGALVSGDEVSIVHVGDSRAYLLRDGELRQLTRDHSLVEELRRQGQLTERGGRGASAALDHHARAGPEPEVELDLHTHQARSGDVFLLCSDGLTGMVREDRLPRDPRRTAPLCRRRSTSWSRRPTGTAAATTSPSSRSGSVRGRRDGRGRRHSRATRSPISNPATSAPPLPRRPWKRGREERGPRASRPPAVPPAGAAGRRVRRARGAESARRPLRVAIVTVICLAVLGGLRDRRDPGAAQRLLHRPGRSRSGDALPRRAVRAAVRDRSLPKPVRQLGSAPRTLRPFERRRLLDHELRCRNDAADLDSTVWRRGR